MPDLRPTLGNALAASQKKDNVDFSPREPSIAPSSRPSSARLSTSVGFLQSVEVDAAVRIQRSWRGHSVKVFMEELDAWKYDKAVGNSQNKSAGAEKKRSGNVLSVPRQFRPHWQQLLLDVAEAQGVAPKRETTLTAKVLTGDFSAPCRRDEPMVHCFLSSTFTDTETERNLLLEDVVPYLKELGRVVGVEFNDPSEMRWGISSRISAEHVTSEICMREIQRCHHSSHGISYVVFLGNKYGFRPFPAKIPQSEFEMLFPLILKESRSGAKLLTKWFLLDQNIVPPHYVLQPIYTRIPGYLSDNMQQQAFAQQQWNSEYSKMSALLRTAAISTGNVELIRKFSISVTEDEVDEGIFKANDPKRQCVLIHRSIESLPESDPLLSKFVDVDQATGERDVEAQNMLLSLKERTLEALRNETVAPENFKRYSVPWGNGISKETHVAYVNTFLDDMCEILARSIVSVASSCRVSADPVYEETSQHIIFAQNRIKSFYNTNVTSSLLQKINKYIRGEWPNNCPFIVYGNSGNGKTSLLSKAAEETGRFFRSARRRSSVYIRRGSITQLLHQGRRASAAVMDEDHSHLTSAQRAELASAQRPPKSPSPALLRRTPDSVAVSESLSQPSSIDPLAQVAGLRLGGKSPTKTRRSKKASIVAPTENLDPSASGVVIMRLLGTTTDSCTSRRMMRFLCLQIARVYGCNQSLYNDIEDYASSLDEADYKELVCEFHAALRTTTEQRPLVIFLDALNQLTDIQGLALEWFPTILPPNVRLICSTTTTGDGETTFRVINRKLDAHHAADVNLNELAPMTVTDGIYILHSWLSKYKRQLPGWQLSKLISRFKQNPSPLYLKLAFETSLSWRSYSPPSDVTMRKTVRGLINDIFDRLCESHGTELCFASLGCLTVARYGLSNTEMEDILSLNDEVLNEVFEFWVPPVRRLPSLLWQRIRADLKEYLVVRGASGTAVLSWYHRQFVDAAQEKFLCSSEMRVVRHVEIGEYFSGRWYGIKKAYVVGRRPKARDRRHTHAYGSTSTKSVRNLNRLYQLMRITRSDGRLMDDTASVDLKYSSTKNRLLSRLSGRQVRHDDRRVAAQPLLLAGFMTVPYGYQLGTLKLNQRKLSEEVYSYIMAGMWAGVADNLINLDYIEAKVRGGCLQELLEEFNESLSQLMGSGIVDAHLDILASDLQDFRRFVLDHAVLFRHRPHLIVQSALNQPDATSPANIAVKHLFHPTSTRGQQQALLRHVNKPQTKELCLATLKGHTDEVTSVAFGNVAHTTRVVASCSNDMYLVLWNVDTGEVKWKVKCHSPQTSVSFSFDGTILATVSVVGSLTIYSVSFGDVLHTTKEAHLGSATCVSFAATTHSLLATAGIDGCVKLWAIVMSTEATGEMRVDAVPYIGILAGHPAPVYSLAFAPDDSFLVSGCQDRIARVWMMSGVHVKLKNVLDKHAIADAGTMELCARIISEASSVLLGVTRSTEAALEGTILSPTMGESTMGDPATPSPAVFNDAESLAGSETDTDNPIKSNKMRVASNLMQMLGRSTSSGTSSTFLTEVQEGSWRRVSSELPRGSFVSPQQGITDNPNFTPEQMLAMAGVTTSANRRMSVMSPLTRPKSAPVLRSPTPGSLNNPTPIPLPVKTMDDDSSSDEDSGYQKSKIDTVLAPSKDNSANSTKKLMYLRSLVMDSQNLRQSFTDRTKLNKLVGGGLTRTRLMKLDAETYQRAPSRPIPTPASEDVSGHVNIYSAGNREEISQSIILTRPPLPRPRSSPSKLGSFSDVRTCSREEATCTEKETGLIPINDTNMRALHKETIEKSSLKISVRPQSAKQSTSRIPLSGRTTRQRPHSAGPLRPSTAAGANSTGFGVSSGGNGGSETENGVAVVRTASGNPLDLNKIIQQDHMSTPEFIRISTPTAVLKGHTHWITSVSVCPASQLVATASRDKTIRLWKVKTGQCLHATTAHAGEVSSVCFSPEGDMLASVGSDKRLKLWNATTCELRATRSGHMEDVLCVDFSRDGKIATGAADNNICIWSGDVRMSSVALKDHSRWVVQVCVSGDGLLLGTLAFDGSVFLYDISTAVKLAELTCAVTVSTIIFSPTNARIFGGLVSGEVVEWTFNRNDLATTAKATRTQRDMRTWAERESEPDADVFDLEVSISPKSVYDGHKEVVSCMCVAKDLPLLVTGSRDCSVRLWRVEWNKLQGLVTWQAHTAWVRCLAFLPDDKHIVSAGRDGGLRLWQLPEHRPKSEMSKQLLVSALENIAEVQEEDSRKALSSTNAHQASGVEPDVGLLPGHGDLESLKNSTRPSSAMSSASSKTTKSSRPQSASSSRPGSAAGSRSTRETVGETTARSSAQETTARTSARETTARSPVRESTARSMRPGSAASQKSKSRPTSAKPPVDKKGNKEKKGNKTKQGEPEVEGISEKEFDLDEPVSTVNIPIEPEIDRTPKLICELSSKRRHWRALAVTSYSPDEWTLAAAEEHGVYIWRHVPTEEDATSLVMKDNLPKFSDKDLQKLVHDGHCHVGTAGEKGSVFPLKPNCPVRCLASLRRTMEHRSDDAPVNVDKQHPDYMDLLSSENGDANAEIDKIVPDSGCNDLKSTSATPQPDDAALNSPVTDSRPNGNTQNKPSNGRNSAPSSRANSRPASAARKRSPDKQSTDGRSRQPSPFLSEVGTATVIPATNPDVLVETVDGENEKAADEMPLYPTEADVQTLVVRRLRRGTGLGRIDSEAKPFVPLSGIHTLSFSCDGRMLCTGSVDKKIRLYNVITGELWMLLEGHTRCVESVTFIPGQKKLASGSMDTDVRIWPADSAGISVDTGCGMPGSHPGMIRAASIPLWAPVMLLASSHAYNVYLWDSRSGKHLFTATDRAWPLDNASDSEEDEMLNCDGEMLYSREYFDEDGVATPRDEAHVPPKQDEDWHRRAAQWSRTGEGFRAISFSPSARLVAAVASDGVLRLWRCADMKLVGRVRAHTKKGSCINWHISRRPWGAVKENATSQAEIIIDSPKPSEDQLIVTGGHDGCVRSWKIVRHTESPRHHQGDDPKSPRHPIDVVPSTGSVPRGEFALEEDKIFAHPRGVKISALAISYTGEILATGASDGVLRLWNWESQLPYMSITDGHLDIINSIGFSPDSQYIVTTCGDRLARIVRSADGKIVRELTGHSHWVISAAFTADARIIVTASYDRIVKLWDVSDLTIASIKDLGGRGRRGASAHVPIFKKPPSKLDIHCVGEAALPAPVMTMSVQNNRVAVGDGSGRINVYVINIVSKKRVNDFKSAFNLNNPSTLSPQLRKLRRSVSGSRMSNASDDENSDSRGNSPPLRGRQKRVSLLEDAVRFRSPVLSVSSPERA
eukprot:Rmarinus@m.16262